MAAGFGVNGSAVEDDFGFGPFLDFVYRAFLGDDGLDAAIARVGAEVEVRLGLESFRELGVGGIGDFLVRAFPGSARAGALLLHRAVEAGPIDAEAADREHVVDEIARQAVGVVELESFVALDSIVKTWFTRRHSTPSSIRFRISGLFDFAIDVRLVAV